MFDEISLKEGVTYNAEKDDIEGSEGLGGNSKFLANDANVFIMCALKVNWKEPVGYVLSSVPLLPLF